MALVTDLSTAQLAFQILGTEVDQFSVIRYRGTEGLCQLYRFEIELERTYGVADLKKIIGNAAVLSINTSRGERWFHGIVSRFERTGETYERSYFRAELVPSVWMLTHRYCSRIFQNKSTPEIIHEVLIGAGIATDRFRMGLLERKYEPREYCVQYRETDYNFIARLMEDEGIWWYFEQSQEDHVIVLADSPAGYKPIEGNPALPFRPPSGMNTNPYTDASSASAVEHVHRFRIGRSVRCDQVSLNDYDFKHPSRDLRTWTSSDPGVGDFVDFPGRYTTQKRADRISDTRYDEFEAGKAMGVGQSHSNRLSPGKTFELTEADPGRSRSYLLTSVTHQGKQAPTHTSTGTNGRSSVLNARIHQSLLAAGRSQDPAIAGLAEGLLEIASRLGMGDATATRTKTSWLYRNGQVAQDLSSTAAASGAHPLDGLTIANQIGDPPEGALVDFDAPVYECRFECIPADCIYRPPRVTPWPIVGGTQTARVVGPEGEDIHVDEYGRVKVHFEWDRVGAHGENDSCWIRVCQGMAGGNYGMMFLPRVGQEVVVDFLEGNPDCPIIIGRVYNADHMPPYELPKEKTKSCIKTQTSKFGGGCNEIRFEDARGKEQLLIQAQGQMDTRVGGSHRHTIGNEHHIKTGAGWIEKVGAEKSVDISSMLVTHIGGSETRRIGSDQKIGVSGNLQTSATGTMSDSSSGYLRAVYGPYECVARTISHLGALNIELKVAASSIVITPGAIYIEAPNVYINSGRGPTSPKVSPPFLPNYMPSEANPADSAEPGFDNRYDGGETIDPGAVPDDVLGHDFDNNEPDDTETTFIDIEMVDEDGNPVPGERYEVTDSADRVKNGTLDQKGFAHVTGIVPGVCRISFPNLDQSVWRRAI